MSRIPPGKALIVLAAAMVPIVVKKFKPFAKQVGKKLEEAGRAMQKSADQTEESVKDKAAKPTEKDIPSSKTASPTGKEEVREQKAKPAAEKSQAQAPAAKKRKEPEKGAAPPKANPKRARKAPPKDMA